MAGSAGQIEGVSAQTQALAASMIDIWGERRSHGNGE